MAKAQQPIHTKEALREQRRAARQVVLAFLGAEKEERLRRIKVGLLGGQIRDGVQTAVRRMEKKRISRIKVRMGGRFLLEALAAKRSRASTSPGP